MNHSPAPWTIDDNCIFDGINALVCTVDYSDDTEETVTASGAHPSGGGRANARLIAAAPEMLAALKGIQETIRATYGRKPDGSLDPDEMGDKSAADIVELLCLSEDEVYAAIEKAEGRSAAVR